MKNAKETGTDTGTVASLVESDGKVKRCMQERERANGRTSSTGVTVAFLPRASQPCSSSVQSSSSSKSRNNDCL
jgi:hypothetical protein